MQIMKTAKIALPLLVGTLVLGGCHSPNPHDTSSAAAAAPVIATTPPPEGAVPAGTLAMVRTTQGIDSTRHGAGHRFTMALEGDLLGTDGKVVAANGSTIYAQLAEAKKSGRLVGKSAMTIVLTGIQIGGQIKPISTTAIKAVTEGSGRDTVRKVGAGAAIGGIAGGSDSARTGAAIGLGAAVLTSGNQIRLPVGTILEFQLTDHLVR
jgi:hypothetical protein